VPALDALVEKLAGANIQPLGVSVDSRHCHLNWGLSLGGVSFPLLQDFHPKGAMATAYGTYLEGGGITDRATVFIDAGGTVQYAASVTPAGERDIPVLVDELIGLAGKYDGELEPTKAPVGLPGDAKLFVKSNCGFSRAALGAHANLHLDNKVPVVNVTESPEAMAELKKITGKEQAPALMLDGQALLESADIIKELCIRTTGWA
jgi:glutaredoxin-related protein